MLLTLLNPKQFLHRGPIYIRQNFGDKKKLKRVTKELKNKVDDFYDVEKKLDKVRDAQEVVKGKARLAKLAAQELELEMRARALTVIIEEMRQEEELLLMLLMDD